MAYQKLNFLNPLFFGNMVVNYKFQEELSWLKLFTVGFSPAFVSMAAVRIEINCFDLVSQWHFFFLPQRMDL